MSVSKAVAYSHFIPQLRRELKDLPDSPRLKIESTLRDLAEQLDALRPDYEPPAPPWSPEFWRQIVDGYTGDEGELVGDGMSGPIEVERAKAPLRDVARRVA